MKPVTARMRESKSRFIVSGVFDMVSVFFCFMGGNGGLLVQNYAKC